MRVNPATETAAGASQRAMTRRCHRLSAGAQFYEHDGPTDINNGALLCGAHHRMLHHEDYTMRMRHGKPELLAPSWIDPTHTWQPIGRTRALMATRPVE
jgi:hypothetical protein